MVILFWLMLCGWYLRFCVELIKILLFKILVLFIWLVLLMGCTSWHWLVSLNVVIFELMECTSWLLKLTGCTSWLVVNSVVLWRMGFTSYDVVLIILLLNDTLEMILNDGKIFVCDIGVFCNAFDGVNGI